MDQVRGREADLPLEFLAKLDDLADRYMRETDPIRQSGFSGGSVRWRAEREPILEAVNSDGDLLDIGCANGYLLECLVAWGRDRGIALEPYGLEQSEPLAGLARERLSGMGDIYVGNAWTWVPPRRYRFVYTMHDLVPESFLSSYLRRLADEFLSTGGRLILGAYGSRSRKEQPFNVEAALGRAGLSVAGTAWAGEPPVAMFAWAIADAEAV